MVNMPRHEEYQYLDLLRDLLHSGIKKEDRTGTGTYALFGHQMRFDLSKGFPLLTTKKLHTRSIFHELLWFISGDTNIRYLQENGVSIWDEWADANGDLGPVYGKQWRDFNGVDQLAQVVDSIRNNPDSRRHIITAWNPVDVPVMALPPCHCLFQFFVAENKLSCQLYQRSCDTFLGVPFNIASYSLLTHMIAHVCNLEVGDFVWTGGDIHLYSDHVHQARLQLQREPYEFPTLKFSDRMIGELEHFCYEDIEVVDYECHAHIKAPISV